MKISSRILSLKKINFLKDKHQLWSFISVIAGLVFGIIVSIFSNNEFNTTLQDLFITYSSDFSNKSNLEVFSGIILLGIPYYIVMFILGGSFFGKFLCAPVTALKAAGLSAIASCIYKSYALKGLEYLLLIFFPGKVVLIFSMLIFTKITMDMSQEINCIRESEFQSIKNQRKIYYIKSLFILLIFILSWTIDFSCMKIFSKLFEF